MVLNQDSLESSGSPILSWFSAQFRGFFGKKNRPISLFSSLFFMFFSFFSCSHRFFDYFSKFQNNSFFSRFFNICSGTLFFMNFIKNLRLGGHFTFSTDNFSEIVCHRSPIWSKFDVFKDLTFFVCFFAPRRTHARPTIKSQRPYEQSH